MKYSLLRTSLLLLTSTTLSFAEVENILANAGKFKPTITLSDVYGETVATVAEDGEVYRSLEIDPQRIAFTLIANLDGATTGVIDAETAIGFTVGNFQHSALIGEAPDYKDTAKKVTFPLTKEMERANGDFYEVTIGSVIYAWTDKQLKVTLTCSDIVAAGVSDIAAGDYVGTADPGTAVSFSGDSIEVAVFFGEANGERRAFLKGVTKTVTRKFGSEDAGTYEEFDVVDVNLKGQADVAGPSVKPVFPSKPSATRTIDITGTALDNQTAVTLDAITVNGVATTPAGLGPEDAGTGVWNWSVTGLPLLKGKNVVVLSFSDEDGNVEKVTKTYTLK